MTTLKQVDKEDLEEGKLYIYVDGNFDYPIAVKVEDGEILFSNTEYNGAGELEDYDRSGFFGPIELEGE